MRITRIVFSIAMTIPCMAGTDVCSKGTDVLGKEQSCYGRCHIYNEGDNVACPGNAALTRSQAKGEACGQSAKNPCISTFNAALDGEKTNCGNCYEVSAHYAHGRSTKVYIKTVDTNSDGSGSVKFEMNEAAWKRLCPVVCAGPGKCEAEASSCEFGAMADTADIPIQCHAEKGLINFERIQCP